MLTQPHLLLRAPRLLAALAFSAALLPLALRADTVRLTDDAGINTTGVPATTGADVTFAVKGKPGKAKESVGYLKFDLTSLPTGTTATNVGKATLRVFLDNSTKEGGTFNVVAVTGTWTEDGINASNAPTLGSVIASDVAAGPELAQNFIDVDITSVVQEWLAGTLVNNGVALVPGNSNLAATFDTKESITTSHPASLNVSLLSTAAKGDTGATGRTGAAGRAGPPGRRRARGSPPASPAPPAPPVRPARRAPLAQPVPPVPLEPLEPLELVELPARPEPPARKVPSA